MDAYLLSLSADSLGAQRTNNKFGTYVREQVTPDGRFNTAEPFHSIVGRNRLAYGS